MLFYEKKYVMKEYDVFKPFLRMDDEYDAGFTKMEHIQSIVDYEREYSSLVKRIAEGNGYAIDIDNSPYFAGFGSTAHVYYVTRNNKQLVLKLTWGFGKFELYCRALYGQYLMEKAGLQDYLPKIYFTLFNGVPTHMDYRSIDNGLVTKRMNTYGVSIQEYCGKTLEYHLINNTLTDAHRKNICRQLSHLKGELLRTHIAHADLHSGNITITSDHKIKMIDLEEVYQIDSTHPGDFDKLDDVIGQLCEKSTHTSIVTPSTSIVTPSTSIVTPSTSIVTPSTSIVTPPISVSHCQCLTKNGRGLQCKNPPIKGKSYCRVHRDCEFRRVI
jgi:hypothetical protein